MEEIQRADPGVRKIAIAGLVVATFVGAAFLLLFDYYRQPLLAWAMADSFRARASVLVLIALGSVPLPVVAAYAWRFGSKVVREHRHPPEGTKLVRDTPVIHGGAALRYGRFYQALGAMFLFAFGCVLWILWQLWRLS